MPHPSINVHLYARPAAIAPGGSRLVCGIALPTLLATNISQTQFQVSFEQVAERLRQFERLDFEMDGSFVCAGVAAGEAWQLDGMLYDYAGRLQRIELKGSCPLSAWQALLLSVAPSPDVVVAHLLDHQCLVAASALEPLWCATHV